MSESNDKMEKIVSLSKRRGYVYPGSGIYGGLSGTWDYGPLGVALKNNIKNLWWKRFVNDREDMYGLDSAILMNQKVWQASGHVRGFADMIIECLKCKRRFRDDHLEDKKKCPECGGKLGEARQFYMMLETHIGALQDESTLSYLRPETAQGMFVNFKNVVDSFHPKLPFGIAQVGKAFRNETAPRDFIFRMRELEQMEVEYFVREKDWKEAFEMWKTEMLEFMKDVGINTESVHELEVSEADRAHYSKRTIDFEFDFPFGRKELYGLAYRTDYDLKNHTAASGVDLSYLDAETGEKIIPHVVEPSLGVDRTVLAVLTSAYSEDDLGGEKRSFLKLSPAVAPVRVAVFPLLRNKPALVEKSFHIYSELKRKILFTAFDDNGNIGKRYRRQDEIGTPYCVTIDFKTLEDDTVTIRDRDSAAQKRVKVGDILNHLKIG
ncbi:MAG: Glycine--tRNA ligase [Parcubacteria group bacterium Gr01-1014_107]|nr:MAG: Glycine--tRNA ligase [Parcubacteria group bacterium Gr01-1014_107]